MATSRFVLITEDDVAQLQGELAEVARDTAGLLLRADYAESDLLELDARARDLRARLRAAALRKSVTGAGVASRV